MDLPTAHAVLRDRRQWLGDRTGLALDGDGVLTLVRVPAPADGEVIDVPTSYPCAREPSGLALGPCGALFIADTANDRVIYVDGNCDSTTALPADPRAGAFAPGVFRAPRGLAFGGPGLWVADSGHARVQMLASPHLEAAGGWHLGPQPVSVAMDLQGRLYCLDATTHRLHRLQAGGAPDPVFDAAVVTAGVLQQPAFVAVTAELALVCDLTANKVFAFDLDGAMVFEIEGPSGWLPGALAVGAGRLFVADASDGCIHVFELEGTQATLLGDVHGYRGPVTALAANDAGDLYVKPGLDAVYHLLTADGAYLPSGDLLAGPFDAGVESEWERAWVEAVEPAGTAVSLSLVVKGDDTPPVAADWRSPGVNDVLLAQQTHENRRYLWLRVSLRGDSRSAPRVTQVRAATPAENLLDYLPLTYGFNDERAGDFLGRWLKLVRGEYSRVEEALDDAPRVTDAQSLPAAALPWVASWLALELPRIADADERREIMARAVQLSARRGAPQSIAELVELHTGIRPTISEEFTQRRLWVLGSSSRLGFDTGLPSLDPLGMVLPEGDEPIGRAIVGESGPLAPHSLGVTLFSEEAFRFCVRVDGYRARDPAMRTEIARIVDREKPAHTDYRIEYLEPDARVGMQSCVGIDIIVGGDPPALMPGPARLGFDSHLAPADTARVGEALLDGGLVLN